MAQAQFDQMAQALAQLQAQVQNQNQEIANQNAVIANLQAAAAAAPAAPAPAAAAGPRFRLNFATYSAEGPNAESDYEAFEQNVRVVARAQQYPYPDVCNAIIAQMRGRAAHMVRDLVGHFDDFADLDAFLDRLRQIFISPAFMEKARSAFYLRMQQKNESIISYHGTMRSLFEKAFHEDERHPEVLRRQFIAGLLNVKIMEELHLNAGNMDYRELLAEAMRLEGSYEILRMNQQRRQQGGQLTAQQNLMMLQHPGTVPATGGTPMELGNINKSPSTAGPRPRGDQRGRPPGFSGGRGRGNGHGNGSVPPRPFGSQPPAGPTGPRPSSQPAPTRPQPSTSAGPFGKVDLSTLSSTQCLSCYGYGHWSYECPSKKKREERQARGTPRFQRGGRGYPFRGQGPQRGRGFGPRPQVHNVEDGASSDSKN